MVANSFRSSSRPPTRIPRYHPQQRQQQKQKESEKPSTATTAILPQPNSSLQNVSSFFQKHTGKATPSPLTLMPVTKKASSSTPPTRKSSSSSRNRRSASQERRVNHRQGHDKKKRAVLESFKFPAPPPPKPSSRSVPSPIVVETVNSHSTQDDQHQQRQPQQDDKRQHQHQQDDKQQQQLEDQQQSKKETILSKRRKFETLMADMLAKQRNSVSKHRKRHNHSPSPSKNHKSSKEGDRKSHSKQHKHQKDHPQQQQQRHPEEQIVFRTQTAATNSPTARRSYSEDQQHRPPSRIFTDNNNNSIAIRRTESHPQHSPAAFYYDNENATVKSDASPFHRLMGSDMMDNDNGPSLSNNNHYDMDNERERNTMSPYTSFQQNILGLLGDGIPVELSPQPLPKRRRGAAQESAYESLQSLRQKAKYNLEQLDHSSRTRADSRTTSVATPTTSKRGKADASREEEESYDFDLTQEDSMEEDSLMEEWGKKQQETIAQRNSKSKQNYILGSCSSLIQEAKKQKEQREPSERMRMSPVPPPQQQREPSERLPSTAVQQEGRAQPPRDPSERKRSWPVPIVQQQKTRQSSKQKHQSTTPKDPSERQQRSTTSVQKRQIPISEGSSQQRKREPSERQRKPYDMISSQSQNSEKQNHNAAATTDHNNPDTRWEEPPGSSPAPLDASLAPTLASHASQLASMAMSAYHYQAPVVQVNPVINVAESITTAEVNSGVDIGDDDEDDTSDIQVLSWNDAKDDPAADIVTDMVASNDDNKKGKTTKGRMTPNQERYQGGRGEGSRMSHGTRSSGASREKSSTPVSRGKGLDASVGGHTSRNRGTTSTPMMRQREGIRARNSQPGKSARDPSGHDREFRDELKVRDEKMALDPRGRDPKGPDPPHLVSPSLVVGEESGSPAESTGQVAPKEDAPERQYSYKIREIKDSDDEHTIICLVDSEEVSGHGYESRSQGAATALINTIRKNIDQRLSRFKSTKVDDSSTQPQAGRQKKLSTFVEDMKQGKNLKESLRQLRKEAKKKVKEEKNTRTKSENSDEEIIFVEDSEDTITGDEKVEGSKVKPMKQEEPPSSPKKRTFRAAAMSPITLDAMLTEEDSAGSSYTSAPSDLMAAPSVRSDFVGTEIHCYDDGSDLAGSFAGLTLEKTETGSHEKEFGLSKGLPSPCTRRRDSLSARRPPKTKALEDPMGNEDFICLPSQISALLQSVGNQFTPSVPGQLLSMSHSSAIMPEEPKWAIKKEYDLAEEVMAITESMALQLGNAFVVSEKVAERQLRAMEETMIKDQKARQDQKLQTGMLVEKKNRKSPSCFTREDRELIYDELRQQLSDVSEAICPSNHGRKPSTIHAGPPPRHPVNGKPKSATGSTIVSSSPIISNFLKRKDSHSANSKARSYTIERYTVEQQQSGQSGTGGKQSGSERQSSTYSSTSDEPRVVSHHVSSVHPEKKTLFGRMVSPLTLPTADEQKKQPVNSSERGPDFPTLRVDRSMLDEATSSGNVTSSHTGLSSVSAKNPAVLDGVSSLGDSTQTDSNASSFMTSFEVKNKLIQSMSSVSESGTESLGSQEPTPTPSQSEQSSSSPPPQSETSARLDPPERVSHQDPPVGSRRVSVSNHRPARPAVTPSPMAGQTSTSETGQEDSENKHSDMSYSEDSRVECTSSTSYYFNEKVPPIQPATSVPTKGRTAAANVGGNPLKKLLYRPRVPRRKNGRNDNPSSSSENDSRLPKVRTVDSADLSSRNSNGYPPASRRREPPPRRPDASERDEARYEHDLLDDELTRLTSWMSVGCGDDPPGMLKKAGDSLGPPPKTMNFSSFNSGVDHLVLASWGIQNRMDRLRQSLTFSPGNSFAPTLSKHKTPSIRRSASDVAASLLEKYQSKHKQNGYYVDEEDAMMVSSVSGRSVTTSSFDELAGSSQDDSKMGGRLLKNAHTMETDRAFVRGWSKRAETPDTLKAFASKSWKLDEKEETDNSLVESDSGQMAFGDESKSGS